MNAFDNVIGYETIKEELLQVCDMINNKDVYKELGAKIPHGVLLWGHPGLGKTLMAKSFIEASGLPAYTLRKNKGDGSFVDAITKSFNEAKENSPAIVFLDDVDKFANEEGNAEEYVAVQAGIDEVKDSDVLVIATANDIDDLPDSLVRSGRFDRKIYVRIPSDDDAAEIISYYLSNKKIADDVNLDDFTKMISYSSCAELETIINEAAISAAYGRKENIEMADLVKAVLRREYLSPDAYAKATPEEIKKIALHEAGHLVVSEVLVPESVGLASVSTSGRNFINGFVHRCKNLERRPYQILAALAGKAAVELYYSETVASGCDEDIERAIRTVRDGISCNATQGLGMLDVSILREGQSNLSNYCTESVTRAELERYMIKAKDILLKNRDFLEKAADALEEKETLLYSDIQAIKESTTITSVAI